MELHSTALKCAHLHKSCHGNRKLSKKILKKGFNACLVRLMPDINPLFSESEFFEEIGR